MAWQEITFARSISICRSLLGDDNSALEEFNSHLVSHGLEKLATREVVRTGVHSKDEVINELKWLLEFVKHNPFEFDASNIDNQEDSSQLQSAPASNGSVAESSLESQVPHESEPVSDSTAQESVISTQVSTASPQGSPEPPQLLVDAPQSHSRQKSSARPQLRPPRKSNGRFAKKEVQVTFEESPEPSPTPESEPLYCFCHKESYGDMVACENEKCPYQWFHIGCLNRMTAPREKNWLCPECRQNKRESSHALKDGAPRTAQESLRKERAQKSEARRRNEAKRRDARRRDAKRRDARRKDDAKKRDERRLADANLKEELRRDAEAKRLETIRRREELRKEEARNSETARNAQASTSTSRSNQKPTSMAAPRELPKKGLYCSCHQAARGPMVACSGEQCPYQWYHLSCLGRTTLPGGFWLCPECRVEQKKKRAHALTSSPRKKARR